MSYFGKFFLRGPDADKAVEWIFTNSIANCPVGKTVYTCMLNKNAGIEADLTVSVLSGGSEVGNDSKYQSLIFMYLANSLLYSSYICH